MKPLSLPLIATGAPPSAGPSYYVVTAEDVTPLCAYPAAELGVGMDSLIEQEVLGQRREAVPCRLSELFRGFGFEWEPLSELGHMRFLGHAAFMLQQAKGHAARVADSVFRNLDIPTVRLSGISLVDPSTPVMDGYLGLISTDECLYGDSPYEVRGAGTSYILRQTGCVQKYSACLSRSLAADSLPVALFEISDSFRREPEETLQLCHRLRRFHLPEGHVHAKDVREAVEVSLRLHPQILLALSELEADLVLLISATHEFARSNQSYFKQLASSAKSPGLLKVSPPGRACEDGVEVDVEYKLVDSTGCCRELSTFQIDEQITKSFGVQCDDGTTPSTIHSVFTGSVERYLYAALDSVVRFETAGIRRCLPHWMTPVVVRVVPADAQAAVSALSVAAQLSAAGIRTELDDRAHDIDSAVRDADSLLVPYVVLVGTDYAVGVRDFRHGEFKRRDVAGIIAEIEGACAPLPAEDFQRLSRRPFNVVGKSQGHLCTS